MKIGSIFSGFVHWKIRNKLIGLIAMVMLLSVLTLTVYNSITTFRNMTRDRGTALVSLGQEAVQGTASVVANDVDALKTLALSPALIEAVEVANEAYLGRDQADIDSEIVTLDEAWKGEHPSIEPLVNDIATNELSGHLRAFIRTFPEEVEVFVTDIQGLNVAMTDRTGDYLQADEDWWQGAYNEGQGGVYVGEVEYDETAQAWAINIGLPIYDKSGQQIIGVLRGTVDISSALSVLSRLTIGETGYATLVDREGRILYANRTEMLMQPISEELFTVVESGQVGWRSDLADIEGNSAIVSYSFLEGELAEPLGWTMLLDQDLSEINAEIGRTLLGNLAAAGIVALVCVVIGMWAAGSLSKPLVAATQAAQRLAVGDVASVSNQLDGERTNRDDEVGDLMRSFQQLRDYMQEMVGCVEQIALGDLTLQIMPKDDKDVLGQALDQMVVKLRYLIEQVVESAQSVGFVSNQLTAIANQTSEATTQIAGTIQQMTLGTQEQTEAITRTAGSMEQVTRVIDGVAKGAHNQSEAINQTSQAIQHLAKSVDTISAGTNKQTVAVDAAKSANDALDQAVTEINGLTQQVARFIEGNLESALNGQMVSQEAVTGMDKLGQATEQLAQRIQELGKRSGQIGTVIEVIDDIASQTNLLALNAAIEAARAGEHGKGFAVVADEVRKLAERSSQATQEIRVMIEAVQTGAKDAVTAMEQAGADVQAGVALTREAGQAFETISNGTAESSQQIEATLQAVQVIQAATEQLKEAITSVVAVAEQNRTEAHEMKQTANTVTVSVQEVSAVVEENTASMEEMAASSAEVGEAIERIASVSEENSATVQEVSAATEEMNAQTAEVSASAQSLHEMAQRLQDMVARFKVSRGHPAAQTKMSAPVEKKSVSDQPPAHPPVSEKVKVAGNGHH